MKLFFKTLPISAFPLLMISCGVEYYQTNIDVENVIDGDTFTEKESSNKYRIFGIDTKEMTTASSDGTRTPTSGTERYWAEKATNRLKNLIEGQKVQIIKINKDIYDRDVVKVFINSKDVAHILIQEGLAEVKYISNDIKDNFFNKDVEYYKELIKLSSIAQNKRIGIWS